MPATSTQAAKSKGSVAGRRKRNRKREGGKQGKVSWVTGTKLAFLERYKEPWISAGDTPARFYSDITKRFILKYGWDERYSQRGDDLEDDTDDPKDEEVAAFVSPEDEVEERAEYYYRLRTKIAQWYRYHYKKILAEDSLEASVEALLSGLGGPRKPRKRRVLHQYSEQYYASRIKSFYEEELVKEMEAWKDGKLEVKPESVNVRNCVVDERWAAESDSFRNRLETEVKQAHQDAMEEYNAAMEAARGAADGRTPQEFHKLLSSAAATLDPLAESLAARYGMAVSILLAGPIPEKGGAIEVLSTHAGKTRGRAPKGWPEADHTGFTGVVTSMTRFATLAFSQSECDARALPNVPVASRPRLATGAPAANSSAGGGLTGGAFGTGTGSGRKGGDEENDDGEEEEEEEEEEEVVLSSLSVVARKAREKAKTARENRRKEKQKAVEGSGVEVPAPAPARPRPRPRPLGRNGGNGAESSKEPASSTGGDVNASAGTTTSAPGISVTAAGGAAVGGAAAAAGGAAAGGPAAAAAASQPEATPPPAKEPTAPPPWKTVGQGRWTEELKRVWPWFEQIGATWGECWEDCSFGYLAFEEASGFPFERVRLPKGPRAGLGVDSWIATGRKLTWGPCLAELEEVRGTFWRWWWGMQPEERRMAEGVMSRKSGIDWAGLRDYSGKNGLLQVMMVLGWWGDKAHGEKVGGPEEVAQWESAVDDVAWALEEMVKEGKLSKKRAQERGVEDKAPPAKKARLA
ncbi:hypothetical protein B0H11DRAFT_2421170 [Mycena galericulata]|nr:hypothetical protein B0H11DRAFT_2421170 [Mycena galericulata]